MLDLRRLRLLHELAERGTIAAVADALHLTPSAVSQQLAILQREAGVELLERAGRGVRLTDPALVLVGHAEALLERAARAEADLAAAAGAVVGRVRIAAFQSAAVQLALPAMEALAREAPRLRCELVQAEPEQALPGLAVGDLDLVLGDEWRHQPWRLPLGVVREELLRDPVRLVLPAGWQRRELSDLRDAPWVSGHPGMGWEELVLRTCRERGGFEPDIRHRTDDATVALALTGLGLACTLLPELALRGAAPGVVSREQPGLERTIYAVTRAVDARRPSLQAVLAALRSR